MTDPPVLRASTREGVELTSLLTAPEAFALIDRITDGEHLRLAEVETDRFVSAADEAWRTLETKAIQYLGGFGVVAAIVGSSSLPGGTYWPALVTRGALAIFGLAGVAAVVGAVRSLSIRTLTAVNPAAILGDPNRGQAFSEGDYRRFLLKARWESALRQADVHAGKAKALRQSEVALCLSVVALAVGIVARMVAG